MRMDFVAMNDIKNDSFKKHCHDWYELLFFVDANGEYVVEDMTYEVRGGDAVLKRMNRHYTSAQYAAKVALIREAFPDAAVTTDLICGFPTETEGDFEQSLAFVESMRFAQVHVFGYSPRSGTVAAKLPQLPANVVEERVARAVAVAEKCKREFLSALVGKRLDVLAEQYEDGCTSGHSLEFVKAYVPGRHDGELSVTVKQLYKDGVIAE